MNAISSTTAGKPATASKPAIATDPSTAAQPQVSTAAQPQVSTAAQPQVSTAAEIISVAVAGAPTPARLLREDYDAILAAGYTGKWFANDSDGTGRYWIVKTWCSRRKQNAIVARLIARADRNEQVRYLDGDRLNLLPANLCTERDLRISKGKRPAKGKCATARLGAQPRVAFPKLPAISNPAPLWCPPRHSKLFIPTPAAPAAPAASAAPAA